MSENTVGWLGAVANEYGVTAEHISRIVTGHAR